MAREFSTARLRETFWILFPAVALVVGAFWFAFQFVEPAPPRSIAIATGGVNGAYFSVGSHYADILKKSGITLEVKPSSGSLANVQFIEDAGSGVDLALLQGGIADQSRAPDLISLGRVFLEPIWVFYRDERVLDKLSQLQGKKIAVGTLKSGTRHLAMELFKKNDLAGSDVDASPLAGVQAVRALEAGQLEAVFLVLSPRSALIERLVRNPDIKLMSFSQADAYSRVLPYLNRVVLPQGVFDFRRNIPHEDVQLLAASTALVARKDFHPALAGLMAQAMVKVHKKGGLFEKAGAFPTKSDPEFPMSREAVEVYKSGPAFLQRYLPFWLASAVNRMIVMIVPFATILLPLIKIVPLLYRWLVRKRLLYWYQRLKTVEVEMARDVSGDYVKAQIAEVQKIEDAVNNIRLPIAFADQLYDLRSAIDLVQQKLTVKLKDPSGLGTLFQR